MDTWVFCVICLTEDRLLWTWPGLDFVLDLRFDEVVEISGNTKGQMRLTYEPANFPRGLRAENPNGQVWVCWFELAPPRCFEVAPPTSALYLFATSLAFFNGMGRSFWGVWSFSVGPRQPPPMSSFMEMGSLQHGQ